MSARESTSTARHGAAIAQMHHHPSTAWDILDAAAAGSPAARDEFARRYGEFIRQQLATRWRGTALHTSIDDACQEVFLECLKPGGVLVRADRSAMEGFRALLAAVVRHVALRAENRRQRQQQLRDGHAPEAVPAPLSSVGHGLDRAYVEALLRAAAEEQARRAENIGDVAMRRVELLRLRFHEGRSIAEIAASWGKEPAYVHHQYAKARADFHRALLTVMGNRSPELTPHALEERCRQLVQLLRSG